MRYGAPVDVGVGDMLFRSGDRWYDLILIESGEVEIVRDALPWVEETSSPPSVRAGSSASSGC